MDPPNTPTPLKATDARWDAAAIDDGFWSEASAPPPQPSEFPVEVRVWLYGSLAAADRRRPIVLQLAPGATAAAVFAGLGQILGAERFADLASVRGDKRSTCRLFVEGKEVEDLSLPLPGCAGCADVEVIVLAGIEGG